MNSVLLLILVLGGALPQESPGQAADTLDTIYDADAVPSATVVEERLERFGESSWTWRSGWAGTSGRHGLRLRFVSERLEFRVAGDHDPGEPLRVAPAPLLMDHLVASLEWKPVKHVSVVAGSFRRAFFHGLTAGDERFGAPSTSARDAARPGRGLRSWAGAGEDRYLQGVALSLQAANITASAWMSLRRLDASVDSAGGRWSVGGRHVTRLEKSRRGAVGFRESGMAMEWSPGLLSVGVVLVRNRFSVPFCSTRCSRPERYRDGLDAGSVSLALQATRGGFTIEVAPRGGAADIVATGHAALRSAGRLQFMLRRVGDVQSPLLASPPSARETPYLGETGLLANWRVRLGRGIHLDITSDQSSSGDSHLGRRTLRMDQIARFVVSARTWSGEVAVRRSLRTVPIVETVSPASHREVIHRIRIRVRAPITSAIESTAFVDASSRSAHAVGVSLEWAPVAGLSLLSGTTEFHGATGGRPIVSWEPSTPLSNPLRSFHGSGRRTWMLVRISGERTRLSFSFGLDRRFPAGAGETERRTLDFSIAATRLLRGYR